MSRIKKALAFMVALYAISITMSSCRGCPGYTKYFELYNFRILLSSIEHGTALDTRTPIAKTDLNIDIIPEAREVSRTPLSRGGFSVISKAQAMWHCHCPHVLIHSVASITITSRSENSEGYQVEIDVTASFNGRIIRYGGFYEVSIDELIYYYNNSFQSLRLVVRDDSIDLTGRQTFEISLTLDDGVVLVRETEELELV